MAATDTETTLTGEDLGKKQLTIDVKVDVKSTCERHVVVVVPESEVDRYRREAFDEVTPKAELPGFRAGKAPRKLVESRFREQVAEQVKSSLVMDSLQQITEGDYFSAISEPNFDFEAVELPDDGDFKYEFLIEVRPDFDTPQWEGLELRRPVCKFDDTLVDEHLVRTLKRFTPGEAVDGPAQLGDVVTLSGEFAFGGNVISRFEEETVTVSPSLSFSDAKIEDFGELITGVAEGESFSTKVTLSDEAANAELSGKEVDATFEIVEVKRIQVEEVGPAMLANLGFESTEELRKFVRIELERQFEYHQQQSLRKQIVKILTKDANWELPESLVRRQTNRELQRLVLELQRSGFSQQQINSYVNASRMNARQSTIEALREHFVLEKIAEDLKVEPAAEDYDKEIELIAEQNDSSPRRIRAKLEKSGQMDAIRNQIIERHVINRITEAGKIEEEEDRSFMKSNSQEENLVFSIAGEFQDIPEAKHNNEATVPGALKLPEKDKGDQ